MENPDLFWFRDRQQDPVYGFCPVCGREIYNPDSEFCWGCEHERSNYHDCKA